jgi:hypothetical protein
MHLTLPSVYLNATGKISACCEFSIRRQVDSFDDLPSIKQELSNKPHQTCLQACGSYSILEKL